MAAIVLAIGGTMLAPYVIERMTDDGFRQWSRVDHLHDRHRLHHPRRLAVLAGLTAVALAAG